MKTAMPATLLTTALMTASVVTANVHADDWTGHTSLLLGSKPIAEDDWAKNDEHGAIAVLTDFRKQSWPVSIAIDLYGTGSERKTAGDKYETYTAEAHLGLRKVFDYDTGFQPYFGGGIALINAEQKSRVDSVSESEEDQTTSFWISVGTYYSLGESVTVGADIRYVDGEVTLDNSDIDLSGTTTGLSLGYHW